MVLVVGVVVPAAFDAFGGGRTPGRRLTGLQLVMEDGATVSLVPAAVRNIVRIVDFLPSLYSVGAIAVLVTPRHQRLGDLAAGTLVVRSIGARSSAGLVVPGAVRPAASDDLLLDAEARARVAAELARRLEPVVSGPDRTGGDEAFLEQVLAAREARAR